MSDKTRSSGELVPKRPCAEQHDDFKIAATVKVGDLMNEANGPVPRPLVLGKENVPNHAAVAPGDPGQSVLSYRRASARPRPQRKVRKQDVLQEYIGRAAAIAGVGVNSYDVSPGKRPRAQRRRNRRRPEPLARAA